MFLSPRSLVFAGADRANSIRLQPHEASAEAEPLAGFIIGKDPL